MRARRKKWTDRELNENARVILFPPERGGLNKFFLNENPLHVELGCGKGRFVVLNAIRNPEINFVAVEREPSILASAARYAAERENETDSKLNNLLLVKSDASELESIFDDGGIRRLYINFCDPWPNKKKWAKRRLTHTTFLQIYERLAIPEIFFKTDNRLLFEFSIESLSARGWRMEKVSLDLHADGMPGDGLMTEYEEKFVNSGQPIYRLEAYRVIQPTPE